MMYTIINRAQIGPVAGIIEGLHPGSLVAGAHLYRNRVDVCVLFVPCQVEADLLQQLGAELHRQVIGERRDGSLWLEIDRHDDY